MSNRSDFNAEKEATFRKLLRSATSEAWTYFDPKYPGVIVPSHLKQSKVCVLQWGLKMEVPVRHFVISAEAVSGLLVFRGMWESCFVPWEAIDRMQGAYGANDTWFSHSGRAAGEPEAPMAKVIDMQTWARAKVAKMLRG